MSRRLIALVATCVMALQSAGCGLLIYPERKGQKSGSIDPGVAILDAAGLLLFVVPGLIAFGVDFITGCIYLPGGRRASTEGEPLKTARRAGGEAEAGRPRLGRARGDVPAGLREPAVRPAAPGKGTPPFS